MAGGWKISGSIINIEFVAARERNPLCLFRALSRRRAESRDPLLGATSSLNGASRLSPGRRFTGGQTAIDSVYSAEPHCDDQHTRHSLIKGLHPNASRCRDSEETRIFYDDF